MRKPSSLWPWVSILPSFVPRARREYGQQLNMVPMFPQHEDLKLLELELCESQKILLLISVAALGVALYFISNNIVVVDVIFAYDLNIVFPLTNHRLGLEEEINILYIQFTL